MVPSCFQATLEANEEQEHDDVVGGQWLGGDLRFAWSRCGTKSTTPPHPWGVGVFTFMDERNAQLQALGCEMSHQQKTLVAISARSRSNALTLPDICNTSFFITLTIVSSKDREGRELLGKHLGNTNHGFAIACFFAMG